MTRRVLLGRRGSSSGLWVSKPGADVVTTDAAGLMLATDTPSLQIVASGVIVAPQNGSTHDRTIPDLGFRPLILTSGHRQMAFSFPNSTTVRIKVYASIPYSTMHVDVHWAMTNQPVLI